MSVTETVVCSLVILLATTLLAVIGWLIRLILDVRDNTAGLKPRLVRLEEDTEQQWRLIHLQREHCVAMHATPVPTD